MTKAKRETAPTSYICNHYLSLSIWLQQYALIGCFLVMTGYYYLGVQGIYNLCSTRWWTYLWTPMLWSIDSCQKNYPLTSVTWLYYGIKCTTHWGDAFSKRYPLTSCWFQLIAGLSPSSVRPLQGNLRPQPWCIGRAIAPSIHQGLGLRFPCNDLTLG